MAKSLVIVESPAKAKTIEKFLGKSHYTVKASVGHIRDLPKSKLGVDIENNFEPQWIVPEEGQFYVQVMGLYGKIEDDPLVNKHIMQTQPWGTDTVLKQCLDECLREYALADKTGTIGGTPEILTIT